MYFVVRAASSTDENIYKDAFYNSLDVSMENAWMICKVLGEQRKNNSISKNEILKCHNSVEKMKTKYITLLSKKLLRYFYSHKIKYIL